MSHVNVNGTKIYYEASNGKNPLVVFVHGAGGSSQCWSGQLATLDGKYRAVAVDLPGHGKSSGEPLSTVTGLAEFIADFTRSLPIDRFVLAGHSMGGAVAQEFALGYPDRLLGLILIGTGARLRVSPQILGALAGGRLPFASASHLYATTAAADLLSAAFEDLRQVPTAVFHADFQACNRFDRVGDVANIKLPTQIIVGDQDTMTPLKYSQFLHNTIERSALTIIPGTGHMCMQEKPEDVTTTVMDFLNRLSR